MPVPDTANPVRHVQRRSAVRFFVDDQREDQDAVHSRDRLWCLCRYIRPRPAINWFISMYHTQSDFLSILNPPTPIFTFTSERTQVLIFGTFKYS